MRCLDSLYHSWMELDFDIAGWVKDARTRWGQSQEALGERLGKTKGNISAWEKGRHDPSFRQLLQIAAITGHPLPASMGVKLTGAAANDAHRVDADELINLIQAFRDATPEERTAFLTLCGRVLKRQGRSAEKPSGN